ncbi:MAG: NUDIX hydrolase [bacterium]|nr:NUDIX hydrolase [bacterium]
MIIDKVLVIATAVIRNAKKQVLLVQRSEKSSYPGYWQLVEGKLEKGESPIKAIKREISEEIGAVTSQLEINSVFYNETEAKGLRYLCFRIVYATAISSDKIQTSDEHRSFGWFNRKEAVRLLLLPGTEDILNKLPVS